MSFCGTPFINVIPSKDFRSELAALPLPERIRRIEGKLAETTGALAARDEKLFALRGDFDALTMDFWNAFARRLGCENPSETIARQQAWQRSVGHIGTILFFVVVTVLLVVYLQNCGSTGSAISIGMLGTFVISMIIGWPMLEIARAQRAADILRNEQEPINTLESGNSGICVKDITRLAFEGFLNRLQSKCTNPQLYFEHSDNTFAPIQRSSALSP
jgi:hypothetical protein